MLTAPAPALSSQQHQLLYVNSRPASCPVLAQMLRDWFIKHVSASAGQLGSGSTIAGTAVIHCLWALEGMRMLPTSGLQQM